MTNNKPRILIGEKGFTLIELMIVIAIIGILAAVAIPNFIAYRDKAFCSAAENDARSIAATLADYFAIPSHTDLAVGASGMFLVDNPLQYSDGFSGEGGWVQTSSGLTKTSSPKFSALSGNNHAIINGSVANLIIIVNDGSGRCPEDYMKASTGWDETNHKFTKKME